MLVTIRGHLRTLAALVVLTSCGNAATEGEVIDLRTPESTVLTYCQANDIETIRRCFDEGLRLEESIAKQIWSSCQIVTVREARINGGSTHAQPEDVEVVTEVRMIDPDRENPLTRFWYLLRRQDSEWKIVSHSHIPDENYRLID